MIRKNPEQYLAGLNLFPLKKEMITTLAKLIFTEAPSAKLAEDISIDHEMGVQVDPPKLNELIFHLNARLWAIFPSGQPLINQTGETTIYTTLDERHFPMDRTIYFKRPNTPDIDPCEETDKKTLMDSFSIN